MKTNRKLIDYIRPALELQCKHSVYNRNANSLMILSLSVCSLLHDCHDGSFTFTLTRVPATDKEVRV